MGAALNKENNKKKTPPGCLGLMLITEIDGPSNLVWDVLTRVSEFPRFLRSVESVEHIHHTNTDNFAKAQIERGVRWKEIRRIQKTGELETIYKTLTSIQDETEPRSMGVLVGFQGRRQHETITCHMTLESLSPNRCRAVASVAYMPNTFAGRVCLFFIKGGLKRHIRGLTSQDHDDLIAEVRRRQQQQSGQPGATEKPKVHVQDEDETAASQVSAVLIAA